MKNGKRIFFTTQRIGNGILVYVNSYIDGNDTTYLYVLNRDKILALAQVIHKDGSYISYYTEGDFIGWKKEARTKDFHLTLYEYSQTRADGVVTYNVTVTQKVPEYFSNNKHRINDVVPNLSGASALLASPAFYIQVSQKTTNNIDKDDYAINNPPILGDASFNYLKYDLHWNLTEVLTQDRSKLTFENGVFRNAHDMDGHDFTFTLQGTDLAGIIVDINQRGLVSRYDSAGNLTSIKNGDLTIYYKAGADGKPAIDYILKDDGTRINPLENKPIRFDDKGTITKANITAHNLSWETIKNKLITNGWAELLTNETDTLRLKVYVRDISAQLGAEFGSDALNVQVLLEGAVKGEILDGIVVATDGTQMAYENGALKYIVTSDYHNFFPGFVVFCYYQH